MKKILALVLALMLTVCAFAALAEGVMTHEDYVAAELETEVTVETYVQAKQGWWENNGVGNATIYTQAEDGAYFLYNLPMSQEDYEKLVPGTKIRVTGYKAEWSGEVEIPFPAGENHLIYSIARAAYLGVYTSLQRVRTADLGTRAADLGD